MQFTTYGWPPYDPKPRPLLAIDTSRCRGWPPAAGRDVLATLRRHGLASLILEPGYFPPVEGWALHLDVTPPRFSVRDAQIRTVFSGPLTGNELSWMESVITQQMCIVVVGDGVEELSRDMSAVWDAARRGAVVAGMVGLAADDGSPLTPAWWPAMISWFRRLSTRGI